MMCEMVRSKLLEVDDNLVRASMVTGGVAKGRPTKKQVPRLACATALPKPIAARASASLRRLMATTALNGPPLGCAAAAARG
jgi:hypothetical protein